MANEPPMSMTANERTASLAQQAESDAVALKAFRRLVDFWSLGNDEAAALVDAKERTWGRMKKADWRGELSKDQRLHLSALIGLYKGLHLYFSDTLADRWVKLANDGPLFQGGSPLRYMIDGGLPAILKARLYVDALRGGV